MAIAKKSHHFVSCCLCQMLPMTGSEKIGGMFFSQQHNIMGSYMGKGGGGLRGVNPRPGKSWGAF
jgi:hypothetical protein